MASILWKPTSRMRVYAVGAAYQRDDGAFYLSVTYAVVRANSRSEALAEAIRSGVLDLDRIRPRWLPAVVDMTYGLRARSHLGVRTAQLGEELGGPLDYVPF